MATPTINLIPAQVCLSIRRRHHLRRWMVSGVVAAVAVLMALALDWAQRTKAGELTDQSAQLQSELAGVRGELRRVTADVTDVLLQIERANALRAKRAWSGLITLIGSCMPDGCWLSTISTEPVMPTERTQRHARGQTEQVASDDPPVMTIEAPRKLVIDGYATDAAEPYAFVARLKEAQVFAEVTLTNSAREAVFDGYYFRFKLVCEW